MIKINQFIKYKIKLNNENLIYILKYDKKLHKEKESYFIEQI